MGEECDEAWSGVEGAVVRWGDDAWSWWMMTIMKWWWWEGDEDEDD